MRDKVADEIMECARGVFARYGYSKTTMDDIAKKAGKAKSSLYHYYKSKEDVFEAVVSSEVENLFSGVAAAVREVEKPEEKLSTFFLTRFAYLKSFASRYSGLLEDFLKQSGLSETLRKKYEKRKIAEVADILRAGLLSGSFRIKDPEETASVITKAFFGLEMCAMHAPGLVTKKQIKHLLDILIPGLEKK